MRRGLRSCPRRLERQTICEWYHKGSTFSDPECWSGRIASMTTRSMLNQLKKFFEATGALSFVIYWLTARMKKENYGLGWNPPWFTRRPWSCNWPARLIKNAFADHDVRVLCPAIFHNDWELVQSDQRESSFYLLVYTLRFNILLIPVFNFPKRDLGSI